MTTKLPFAKTKTQHFATTLATFFLGLMVSVPFLQPFHTLPIPSFHTEWLAMVLGLGALTTIAVYAEKPGLWIPRIATAPMALVAVVLLQRAIGMFAYKATAFTLTLFLIWCTTLTITGRTLVVTVGERTLTTRLAWSLLVGGLLNALAGMLQYAGLSEAVTPFISSPLDLSIFGIYGNLGQENHFATHMALTLVASSYLCFSGQLRLRWHSVWTCFCLIALTLSGSRSSFLFLTWIVFLYVWFSRLNTKALNRKRLFYWIGAAALTTVLGLWFVMHFGSAVPQLNRLMTLSSAVGPRVFLWQHAIKMFLDSPVLGVGFDAFAYRMVGQLKPLIDPVVFGIDQYAHNLVLHLLAVSGLLGLVAVAWPGLAYLGRLVRAPYPVERMWSWGVIGILLIHSMLEQPLFYSYFLGLVALVAGASDPSAWNVALRGWTRGLFIASCAIALLLLAKTAHDYDQIEGHFYSGRYASPFGDQRMAVERKVMLDLSRSSIFSPVADLIAPQHFVPTNAPTGEKLAFNQRVMHYAPIAEVLFRQAALLAEDGQVEPAMQQFAQAARAYPREAPLYVKRFEALASTDPATYGRIATFANMWMRAADPMIKP